MPGKARPVGGGEGQPGRQRPEVGRRHQTTLDLGPSERLPVRREGAAGWAGASLGATAVLPTALALSHAPRQMPRALGLPPTRANSTLSPGKNISLPIRLTPRKSRLF